jgi:hypothetical protein
VLRIRELREWAANLGPDEFRQQLGPFVLMQRPVEGVLEQVSLSLRSGPTIGMSKQSRLVPEVLAMLKAFDSLKVASLPNLDASRALYVGRVPECELCVDEPSVSKKHAVLRWDAGARTCTLQDLGSTNGTYLNTRRLGEQLEPLSDGDALSFGDAQFLYFHADTLRHHLQPRNPQA